jgi:hypothetical protein
MRTCGEGREGVCAPVILRALQVPGKHQGFVHIKTCRPFPPPSYPTMHPQPRARALRARPVPIRAGASDVESMIVPVEIHVMKGGLHHHPEELDFGVTLFIP